MKQNYWLFNFFSLLRLDVEEALPESIKHFCSSTSMKFSTTGMGFIRRPEMQHAAENPAVIRIAPCVPKRPSINSTKGAIMTVPKPVPHLQCKLYESEICFKESINNPNIF